MAYPRITNRQLDNLVNQINEAMGTPMEPYTKNSAGEYKPQANNYHLSGAYGGVSLHKMSATKGCSGISDVFSCGHITKRDLHDRMHAFLIGARKPLDISSDQ